ncbi:hypothetical protein BX600DRAFT_255588 [Xylariales sp. PMI_506]|nr:hypothetical protein BX600DRAFT_255588 [Xylariales sp. PMI_506]
MTLEEEKSISAYIRAAAWAHCRCPGDTSSSSCQVSIKYQTITHSKWSSASTSAADSGPWIFEVRLCCVLHERITSGSLLSITSNWDAIIQPNHAVKQAASQVAGTDNTKTHILLSYDIPNAETIIDENEAGGMLGHAMTRPWLGAGATSPRIRSTAPGKRCDSSPSSQGRVASQQSLLLTWPRNSGFHDNVANEGWLVIFITSIYKYHEDRKAAWYLRPQCPIP